MDNPIHQALCRRHPKYSAWHEKTRNIVLMWGVLVMVTVLNALVMVEGISNQSSMIAGL